MARGWQLHTVREFKSVGRPLSALTEQWDDLESREQALGIAEGQPILLTPSGHPDPDVLRYLNSFSFRRLANQSKKSYATDLKVYFNFLSSQGRDWRTATEEDFLSYEFWRRRDPRNTRKISGTKFARELAAIARFYDWQVARDVLRESPIRAKEVRRRDGRVERKFALSPTNARRSNVKWLTPRAYRRWRDTGLGGYAANGLRDTRWRGRNDGRNVAFADLVWASGLRLTEAATLLTFELPERTDDERYLRARVGEAVAKGGAKRDFWISQNALERISTYMQIDRKAAIDRAKYEGRYSELGGMIVAEKVTRNRDLVFHDDRGVRHSAALDELASEVRAKVFREVEGELEPASLWLSEAGLPMPPESWEAIFRTANQRCAAHGVAIHCYPHMLRHSFALKMLVTLMHAFDRRMGLSPAERQEYRMLFGDPWVLVQTMLGHRSPETTRDTYLEPVKGLQVDHFLNDSNDDDFPIDALLSRIAEASPRVKDDP